MKTNKPILIPEHSTSPTITGCWCHSPYHSIYWYKERDDDGNITLAFNLFVNPLVGFWQRVKNAIKYIFNIGSLEFDEWRISNKSFNDFVKLVDAVKDDRRFDNIDNLESEEDLFEETTKIHYPDNDCASINTENANTILETKALIEKSNILFSELIQYENLISKYFDDKGEGRPKPLTKYEAMTCINYIDGNVNGLSLENRDKFRKQFNDSCLSDYIRYSDIVRLWGGFKKFKEDFKS